MNKIFALVLVAIASLALPARAQNITGNLTYSGPTTLIAGGTNNLAVVTTNTVNLSIPVPRADGFVLFISGRPMLSNNVCITAVIQKSADNTTFDTLNPITVELNGTTNTTSGAVVSLATNLNVGAVPYLRLRTIGSKEGVAVITNLTVSYGIKR